MTFRESFDKLAGLAASLALEGLLNELHAHRSRGPGAFVAYFVLGGLAFTVPSMKNEFLKYPAVYRSQQGQMSHMPVGMAAMFVSMVALSVIYAMLYQAGSGIAAGARFGALIGVFAVCAFVLHNFVNLNIGLQLTIHRP